MTEEEWNKIIGRLNEVEYLTSGAKEYICVECKKVIPKGKQHIVDEKKHFHIPCWKNE